MFQMLDSWLYLPSCPNRWNDIYTYHKIVHVYLINNLPVLLHFYNFSFFLEKNMLSFFLRYLQQKSGRFICVQLLQTLNILFENIRNETSLCKPPFISIMYIFFISQYPVHLFVYSLTLTRTIKAMYVVSVSHNIFVPFNSLIIWSSFDFPSLIKS